MRFKICLLLLMATLMSFSGFVYASEKVADLTGKVAVCVGPMTYCFEGVDNDGDVFSLYIEVCFYCFDY